jgi:hypothetical protein
MKSNEEIIAQAAMGSMDALLALRNSAWKIIEMYEQVPESWYSIARVQVIRETIFRIDDEFVCWSDCTFCPGL